MLTAHETMKTAWSNFKTYPRFWQIILFNFIALVPSLFVTLYMQGQTEIDVPAYIGMGDGFSLIAGIPAYITYFLTGMAITHYVCGGWTFNSFSEFLRPPSSRWKLFWKVLVLYFLMFAVFILGAGALGWVIAMLPIMGQFTIGALGGIVMLGFMLVMFTKLFLVNSYFTMNDEAPLLSPLKFSDEYFWYLSRVLGWMFLYGILFFILFVVILGVVGIVAAMIGIVGLAVVTCVTLILQTLATMITVFIYSEVYKQIAENKS